MKASELINLLQGIIREHGDLDINLEYDGTYFPPKKITVEHDGTATIE